MICSVYDPQRRIFSYYECPGTAREHGIQGTKYRPPNRAPDKSNALGTAIGLVPEALAVVLPPGAQPIGTGTRAKGVIAVRHGGDVFDALVNQTGGSGPALRGTLSGLGEEPPVPPPPPATSFTQVVAAACIASIVGVLVQKALK